MLIALSGAVVLNIEGGYWWIPWWVAAVVAVAMVRGLWLLRLRSGPEARRDTEACLRQLGNFALLAGLVWSAVPLMQIGDIETMAGALTAFLMAGISAGALIQSMTLAQPGILFFTPILLSTTGTFLAQGNLPCAVIGANTLLLLVMMILQARRASARFWQGEEARLSSQALARSLNESNRKLDYLANHDSLTGLPNRAAFNAELSAREARGAALALAVVDLDNFKLINDTHGHLVGDKVLIEAADDGKRAEALCEKVVAAMERPFVTDGIASPVGASIGLALFPQDAAELSGLFAAADMALYAAKEKGKRRVSRFDAELRVKLQRGQRIEAEIGDALADGRLNVVFQGQHDLRTGAVIGHETLIRWSHPELGAISPPEIIAAVRSADMGDRLTAFVATEACRLLRALTHAGDTTSTVAINISPGEFLTGKPVDILLATIDRFAIRPDRFEVEVTEETIHDLTGVGAELRRLVDTGVRIAIDDFGAGHSSLVKLASLPFGRLKIDRSLIAGIDAREKNAQLIGTLINLGTQLNFTVLAEGVETPAEADMLSRYGCTEVQGFHFSRPVAAKEILAKVRDENARVERLKRIS